MRYYFYLNQRHFPSSDDLLWSWYRDRDIDDVMSMVRKHINPEVQEWLNTHTGDHDLRAYVIPFSEVKVLVGFRNPHNAMLFKLTWL